MPAKKHKRTDEAFRETLLDTTSWFKACAKEAHKRLDMWAKTKGEFHKNIDEDIKRRKRKAPTDKKKYRLTTMDEYTSKWSRKPVKRVSGKVKKIKRKMKQLSLGEMKHKYRGDIYKKKPQKS